MRNWEWFFDEESMMNGRSLSSFSQTWVWFQSQFVPRNIHQDRISRCHSALDEVFVTELANLTKLTEAGDFTCRYALFAPNAFRLLIIPVGNAFLPENAACLENGLCSSCRNHCRIKDMFFWKPCKEAMFFGHKAPRFLCLHPLEQLVPNAVHLGSMKQISFSLPSLLECDCASMQAIMAGFAKGQEIRFPIASVFAAKNEMVNFQTVILRFSLTVLTGVAISCEHIGFGIGVAVVDPFLIQPLVLQHLWIFQCLGIKGSRFKHNGCDRQYPLHKADFSQMCVDFARHGG